MHCMKRHTGPVPPVLPPEVVAVPPSLVALVLHPAIRQMAKARRPQGRVLIMKD
jgi:hypothetical protein